MQSPSTRRRRASITLFLPALACGLASLYFGLRTPVNDDDVYHLHSIWMVGQHQIAYRDFFETHPPGLWVALGPVAQSFTIPSSLFLVARALTALLVAIIVWLIARIADVRGVRLIVLTIVAIGVLHRCELWVFRAEYVATTLFVLHLYLTQRALRRNARWSHVLAALPLGLAVSMSIRVLPFLALQPLLILVQSRETARPALSGWVGGLLLGALPAIFYLTLHGLWADAWLWAVHFVSSSDVVTWTYALAWHDLLLLALGALSVGLLVTSEHPQPSGWLCSVAWALAAAFHVLNPHRVTFAPVAFYLMSALVVVALPFPATDESRGLWRSIAAATIVAALIFSAYWIRPGPLRFERSTQHAQLELLDWLKRVAGDEGVVLVAPHHPITSRDATDLQNAWAYGLWLGSPLIRARLLDVGNRLLAAQPPVLAASPWRQQTDDRDLIDWLAFNDLLTAPQVAALRRMLAASYVEVTFRNLQRFQDSFGNRFWVRRDRLAAAPPPSDAVVAESPVP